AFDKEITRHVTNTVRTRIETIRGLALSGAKLRIINLIANLLETNGTETPEGILITGVCQQYIANHTGISREAAAHTLKDLKERGWLKDSRARNVLLVSQPGLFLMPPEEILQKPITPTQRPK